MSRNITFAPGEFYHIYNRGTEKRKIFMNKQDYDRFLVLLYTCNTTLPVRIDDFTQGSTLRELFTKFDQENSLVDIVAYCLMPNHFHILIHEKTTGGISKFMQKITTGFTMYFNTRYERTGSLFQGKYKAAHINNDKYLKYLLSYIHLNPVKLIDPKWKEVSLINHTKAENFLKEYPYSSFLDYCEKERVEKVILTMDVLKNNYENKTPVNFKQSVLEWLKFKPE